MDFPLYIKHPDESVWYEILSNKAFVEYKRIGGAKFPLPETFFRTEIKDGDYSTAVYIQDLLSRVGDGALMRITASEYTERTRSGDTLV